MRKEQKMKRDFPDLRFWKAWETWTAFEGTTCLIVTTLIALVDLFYLIPTAVSVDEKKYEDFVRTRPESFLILEKSQVLNNDGKKYYLILRDSSNKPSDVEVNLDTYTRKNKGEYVTLNWSKQDYNRYDKKAGRRPRYEDPTNGYIGLITYIIGIIGILVSYLGIRCTDYDRRWNGPVTCCTIIFIVLGLIQIGSLIITGIYTRA